MQDSGTGSAQKALAVTLHKSVAKTTEFQLNAVTCSVMHLHIQNNKGVCSTLKLHLHTFSSFIHLTMFLFFIKIVKDLQ